MPQQLYTTSPNADIEKRARELVEKRAYSYATSNFLNRGLREFRLNRSLKRLGKIRSKVNAITNVRGYEQ